MKLRLSVILICLVSTGFAQSSKPLTDRELLALIAGNALSDNVVHEIKANGLNFHPTDLYRQQLTNAGADKSVLDALATAEVPAEVAPSEASLLNHLAQAGKFMRAKEERQSAAELAAAAKDDPLAIELGFVMGELLKRESQWQTAADVYRQVLDAAPDFPEAHVKLAYILYRLQQPDDAMREAKAELVRNPDDPEAHKTLGLALSSKQVFDAALAEYKETLRLKPDYSIVHQNLGILYDQMRDSKDAIAEYKQFFATNEGDSGTHYELGVLLTEQGDNEGGIKEYREAKRLDPTRVDVRQNLGRNLLQFDKDAAIREFRELVAMVPDFPFGHTGLALALLATDDPKSAEPEFRKAAELDPTEPMAAAGIGKALELQLKYDEALAAYARAIEVNPEFFQGYLGEGRIYLLRKQYAQAMAQLKTATNLQPDDWESHDLLGKALLASGDADAAIAEYKSSMLAWPGNVGAYLELARAYEEKGDATQALSYYKQAAEAIPDPKTKGDYEAALKRLAPNGAPKAVEPAAAPDAFDQQIAAAIEGKTPAEAWTAVFNLGNKALSQHTLPDAEKAYKRSMEMADKLPHDRRQLQSVSRLAMVYGMQAKYEECQALMERGLVIAQGLFGPKSAEVAMQLEGLGETASLRKDQASARNFWMRALEIRQSLLGSRDSIVAVDLARLASSYQADNQFDKAEPLALQAYSAVQQTSGEWDPVTENYARRLAEIYIGWQKFDKAEIYCRRIVGVRERQFGAENPMLVASLQSLEEVLTKEGKADEASLVHKRRETIQADEQGAK
jgi:tetratricopeptide (TPR) repeat protein